MKKMGLIVLFFTFGNSIYAQKVLTRIGEVNFEATSASIDAIAAKNNTASCILDKSTGDFVTLVLVKAFKFKMPLMEEHFNENYMESSKFPKATFKGKVLKFDAKKLSSTKTTYDLDGELTIHGVTKQIKTKANLSENGGKVFVTSVFEVKLEDYKIEIPSLVKEKIAKVAKVNFHFTLEEK